MNTGINGVVVVAAVASGVVGGSEGASIVSAGSANGSIALITLAAWAFIVTIALGILAVVVYRRLRRPAASPNAVDGHSVSSGSGASSDLSDFHEVALGGAGTSGANNDAFTIDALDAVADVHQSSSAQPDTSTSINVQM